MLIGISKRDNSARIAEGVTLFILIHLGAVTKSPKETNYPPRLSGFFAEFSTNSRG